MQINQFMLAGLCGLTIGIMALSAVAAEPDTAKKPVRVACVGDSLTSGFKMKSPEKESYPAQLAKLLGDGYEVKGFAEPGRTALRNAERPLWKEKVFADAQTFQPDIVLICLGTNDSWPAIWQKIGGEYDGDMRAMIDLFTKLPSHPKVLLCVPTPLYLDNIPVQQKILVDEVNPAIRKIPKETGCYLIDFYTPLLGKADMFQEDKVHPAPAAGAEMAKLAEHAIVWLPPAENDVAVLKPTIITLNSGTNDSFKDVSPESFEKSLREIVAKAKAINARLVLTTSSPINVQPNADAKIAAQNREKVMKAEALGAKYAEAIRKVAAEKGYPVAETFALMNKLRVEGKEVMTADCIHPNYLGQTMIARSILDAMKYPNVQIPKVFKQQMYPGVIKEWKMRVATVTDKKVQILDAETVKALQPDEAWKTYKLPDAPPAKLATTEDWIEQTRQSGFGLQLETVVGKGKIQAYTTIDCAAEKQAYISTGIGIDTIWLNGKNIFTQSKDWTGFHAGKERIKMQLNKGSNILVAELTGNQFFLSVTDEIIWEKELAK